MHCFRPRTVGFRHDGKTLAWSMKNASKEYATWPLNCGKCLACRLQQSRETALRCLHEASLYKKNSFVTLTYDEKNLKSPRLQYQDIQNFIKKLRSQIYDDELKRLYPNLNTQQLRRAFHKERNKGAKRNNENDPRSSAHSSRISTLQTGEYGDQNKRPHWHILIFNWKPDDLEKKYITDRGDEVYTSKTLTEIWAKGNAELGSVTFDSASYVARYATKKLYHGKDGTHDYNPISKRSSANAIGKKWIERNWRDVFDHGYLVYKKGNRYLTSGVPRYYEKWFKKHHPERWNHYVTQVKSKIIKEASEKQNKITEAEKRENFRRAAKMGLNFTLGKTQRESEEIIMAQKFELLKSNLKL